MLFIIKIDRFPVAGSSFHSHPTGWIDEFQSSGDKRGFALQNEGIFKVDYGPGLLAATGHCFSAAQSERASIKEGSDR